MPDSEFESYVSVDIESAGPFPGAFALLSIGACRVADLEQQFYIELRPDADAFDEQALSISGLSLTKLRQSGAAPAAAMQQFADWLQRVTPAGRRPIFVAFNAPFDWMFVSHYFHRYLGKNPFGHAALDMKAYAMGLRRSSWSDTSFHKLAAVYGGNDALRHNALQDALDQGRLFRQMVLQPDSVRWSEK